MDTLAAQLRLLAAVDMISVRHACKAAGNPAAAMFEALLDDVNILVHFSMRSTLWLWHAVALSNKV